MREIKFRAFDEAKKKMLGIGEFELFHEHDNGLHAGYFDDSGDWQSRILMQFTGLRDKNGVDIYEGDILKIAHEYGEEEYISKVFTDKFGAPFVVNMPKDYVDFDITALGWLFTWLDGVSVEVIGNIYENPELLVENHD